MSFSFRPTYFLNLLKSKLSPCVCILSSFFFVVDFFNSYLCVSNIIVFRQHIQNLGRIVISLYLRNFFCYLDPNVMFLATHFIRNYVNYAGLTITMNVMLCTARLHTSLLCVCGQIHIRKRRRYLISFVVDLVGFWILSSSRIRREFSCTNIQIYI